MHEEDIGRDHGVVVPVRVDPSGEAGPTKRAAAGPEWRASSRGLYVPAGIEVTPAQRVAEAGVLVPAHGGITGWAALAWLGGWWFDGLEPDGATPAPVPIAMSRRRIRHQDGLLLCNERWDPREVLMVDGLRLTTAPRSVAFAMRYARSAWAAVAVLDMASYHDLASVEEVGAWIDLHPSYTGIEQARRGRDLADENAWSPQEVLMRLTWTGAGFPEPLTNRPMFDLRGNHIGTPDLVDPRTGVTGEYEGPMHLGGARRADDLDREHRFRTHGAEPVTMVKGDRMHPDRFLQRLRTAYLEAERRPASERCWTLELPPWWVPTFTVEQRRALTPQRRQTWLRHRQLPPPTC
jgi:hypothetical protein